MLLEGVMKVLEHFDRYLDIPQIKELADQVTDWAGGDGGGRGPGFTAGGPVTVFGIELYTVGSVPRLWLSGLIY